MLTRRVSIVWNRPTRPLSSICSLYSKPTLNKNLVATSQQKMQCIVGGGERGKQWKKCSSYNVWLQDDFLYSIILYLPRESTSWLIALAFLMTDLEKTNSMNSAEFNFLKDFPPNLYFFPPNLAHWTCKLENTSRMSSSYPINDAKYVNSIVISCSTFKKGEK